LECFNRTCDEDGSNCVNHSTPAKGRSCINYKCTGTSDGVRKYATPIKYKETCEHVDEWVENKTKVLDCTAYFCNSDNCNAGAILKVALLPTVFFAIITLI